MMGSDTTAYLSNEGGMTVFAFRGRVLRFLTPPVLEYYAAVKPGIFSHW